MQKKKQNDLMAVFGADESMISGAKEDGETQTWSPEAKDAETMTEEIVNKSASKAIVVKKAALPAKSSKPSVEEKMKTQNEELARKVEKLE